MVQFVSVVLQGLLCSVMLIFWAQLLVNGVDSGFLHLYFSMVRATLFLFNSYFHRRYDAG